MINLARRAMSTLSWFVWIVAFSAVVAVAWLGLNRSVTTVVIEGVLTSEERAAVQRALAPSLQVPLLSLNLSDVVDQVAALSWPQAVSVRRVWPSRLVVSVVKQQVVAAWNDSGYLTSTGQVVSLVSAPEALPQLRSVSSKPPATLEIFQRLASLANQNQHQLLAMDQNNFGEWRITLKPQVTVALGRGDSASELIARLQRFFVVRAARPDSPEKSLLSADVRYANGVAMRWSQSSSMVAQGH